MRSRLLYILSLFLIQGIPLAYSHPGGLDSSGCHNNRKTGEYHCHRAPSPGKEFSTLPTQRGMLRPEKTIDPSVMVMLNTSTGKYHSPTCTWALRCTRNCTLVSKSEASVAGVPCKVCGGG